MIQSTFSISGKSGAEEKITFLLRLGVLGCFVGHGIWGIIGKEGWIPFFQVFYFNDSISRQLMPVIGGMDILIGIIGFFLPNRLLLWWAAAWTVFTAMLRPSAGMGMSEFFERAGNYGVPIAMLVLANAFSSQLSLTKRLELMDWDFTKRIWTVEMILRLSLASLLIGHGGLAFFNDHPVIMRHLEFIGLGVSRETMMVFGGFEMILGMWVLLFPRTRGLLIFVLFYKLFTEFIHPLAGHPRDIFETIERMGDYVIPPILYLIYENFTKKSTAH